ncbi:MAG: serine hydrolase domain-containing protein [Wenzhouxiangella sp.]|jgi:D-alanyl-D-alanine carboxypeptidase|nr:serine hydrolase domain-containing protein [Wenzhouxiangella sp.]
MPSCLLALLLVLTTVSAPLLAQQEAQQTRSERLSATLNDFHERYGFPGATAAIVLSDGTLVTSAVWLADMENGRAMTPKTPMLAASIGKTFVAAVVLDLESKGDLSRADQVSAYLGDRPWFDALPNADSITLDQLLHHSSGLPDHVHLPAFQQSWQRLTTGEGRFDAEQLLSFVAGETPLFEAGKGWAYSDTGYVLLGLVIEAVTGKPWQDVVRARLLDPLALQETIPSDRPDIPGLAVGYVDPDNPFGLATRTADARGRLVWNPAVESAGGGFASTSADLARWGHELFNGTAMDREYLDRLLERVPVADDAPGIFYGTGVAIHAHASRGPVYGHAGWIPAYVSSLRHYAAHGVTVAFQINTDVGVADNASDLVPILEAALADLAITMTQ